MTPPMAPSPAGFAPGGGMPGHLGGAAGAPPAMGAMPANGAGPAMGAAPGYGGPPSSGYRSMTGPPYPSLAPGTPARGGVVFVIIGMSVVIAILVIVLLWALFAR